MEEKKVKHYIEINNNGVKEENEDSDDDEYDDITH